MKFFWCPLNFTPEARPLLASPWPQAYLTQTHTFYTSENVVRINYPGGRLILEKVLGTRVQDLGRDGHSQRLRGVIGLDSRKAEMLRLPFSDTIQKGAHQGPLIQVGLGLNVSTYDNSPQMCTESFFYDLTPISPVKSSFQ